MVLTDSPQDVLSMCSNYVLSPYVLSLSYNMLPVQPCNPFFKRYSKRLSVNINRQIHVYIYIFIYIYILDNRPYVFMHSEY